MQEQQNNHPEYQYLNLVRDVMETGIKKDDRTGVGTISKFGAMMRFSLEDSFPLFTTKRVFWRGVALELLWFISGSTDARILSKQGVKIWDGHSSRAFLDSRGFYDREVGSIGPMYGFLFRHWGAKYVDMDTDYTGQGIDQLKECIRLIKEEPTSRRIVMNMWNASDIDKMSLAPCHCMVQFQVNNGKLSCMMTQRSADLLLGVAFNTSSYALLTCLIAHSCGLQPGEFVHSMGDCHVYLNHIEPAKIQLERTPRPFPKIIFKCDPKDIDDYTMDDFEIVGYNPHPAIKMEMAI